MSHNLGLDCWFGAWLYWFSNYRPGIELEKGKIFVDSIDEFLAFCIVFDGFTLNNTTSRRYFSSTGRAPIRRMYFRAPFYWISCAYFFFLKVIIHVISSFISWFHAYFTYLSRIIIQITSFTWYIPFIWIHLSDRYHENYFIYVYISHIFPSFIGWCHDIWYISPTFTSFSESFLHIDIDIVEYLLHNIIAPLIYLNHCPHIHHICWSMPHNITAILHILYSI